MLRSYSPAGQGARDPTIGCAQPGEGNFPIAGEDYCLPGSFCTRAGAYLPCACEPCAAGTYMSVQNPDFATASSTCSNCDWDSFSALGSAACTKCPNGQYRSASLGHTCLKCPAFTSLKVKDGKLQCCLISCKDAPDAPVPSSQVNIVAKSPPPPPSPKPPSRVPPAPTTPRPHSNKLAPGRYRLIHVDGRSNCKYKSKHLIE